MEEIVIKKYANRKLYDTSRSAYVALSDIFEYATKGSAFKVLDVGYSEPVDITADVLFKAIIDNDALNKKVFTTDMLLAVVKNHNGSLSEAVAKATNIGGV